MTEATASVFQSIAGDSTDLVAETVGYIQDHVEVKVNCIFYSQRNKNYLHSEFHSLLILLLADETVKVKV